MTGDTISGGRQAKASGKLTNHSHQLTQSYDERVLNAASSNATPSGEQQFPW